MSELSDQLESRKIAEIRKGLSTLLESPHKASDLAASLIRRRHHPEFKRVLPKLLPYLPPETRNRFSDAAVPPGSNTPPAKPLPTDRGQRPVNTRPIHQPPSRYSPAHSVAIKTLADKEQLTAKDREILPQYLVDLEHAPENSQYNLLVWLKKIAPQDEQSIESILRLGKTSTKPNIQFSATRLAFKLKREAGLIQGSRFIDRGGLIEDRETGLLWQADGTQSGLLNYYEGQDYANSLSIGRLNDWRLPTGHELATIFPADSLPFRNSGFSTDGTSRRNYWSSHLYGENYAGICIWNDRGGINNCFADRNRAFVRCVHDPINSANRLDRGPVSLRAGKPVSR